MKRRLLIAIATLPLTALSQERILPQDLFVRGQTDDMLVARQLTDNSYEFSLQIERTDAQSALLLHIVSSCAASALAHMRGYASWTTGTPSGGIPPASNVSTVVLLRSPADIASLAPERKWLPFANMRRLRSDCEAVIRPKYLWPKR
jgi:hypothetical protein